MCTCTLLVYYAIILMGGDVMQKAQETFTYLLSTSGVGVALVNIKEVLSIVLLIFSIANIILTLSIAIHNRAKDGFTKEEIEDTKDDIDKAIDEIKNRFKER